MHCRNPGESHPSHKLPETINEEGGGGRAPHHLPRTSSVAVLDPLRMSHLNTDTLATGSSTRRLRTNSQTTCCW